MGNGKYDVSLSSGGVLPITKSNQGAKVGTGQSCIYGGEKVSDNKAYFVNAEAQKNDLHIYKLTENSWNSFYDYGAKTGGLKAEAIAVEHEREVVEDKKPFECDVNSYVFTSDLDSSYTIPLLVDLAEDNASKAIKKGNPFAEAHINAIGFNPVDGFIYGFYYKDYSIIQVDSNYTVRKINISSNSSNHNLPNRHFYLGDVSKDGIYYLTYDEDSHGNSVGISNMYAVDLKNRKFIENIVLDYETNSVTSKIKNADFAINPKDDNLYMVNQDNGQLVRINLKGDKKGQVEELGNSNIQGRSVANFFDKDGNFYFSAEYNKSDGSMGKAIFKIDISEPWSSDDVTKDTKASATFFSNAPIAAGDGARCALAPISHKATLSIDKKKVSIPENNNTKEIIVTIRSNMPLQSDIYIKVAQVPNEGSATVRKDYVHSGIQSILFPKGSTEVSFKISDVVIDDEVVENTENFFYMFYVASGYEDKARFGGEVTKLEVEILDDDEAEFTAYDPNQRGDLSERNITTKIVAKEFTLTLASLNQKSANQPYIRDFDSNSTRVKIVDESECTKAVSLLEENTFSRFTVPENVSSVEQKFRIAYAIKKAKVQFLWKDRFGKEHTSCSKDNFAIRPDKYLFQNPSNHGVLKAGELEAVKIIATTYDSNSSTPSYNENRASFKVEADQNNTNCAYKQSDLNVSGIRKFINGTLDGNFSYKNVGVIDLNISEKKGSEFAKVDEDDTNDSQRLISPASVSLKFVPFAYQLSASYKNTHTDSNYAFYGGLAHGEGPKWSITIEAVDNNGIKLTNFDKECGAIDVPFSLDLNITSSENPTLKSNGEVHGNIVDSNITKDKFVQGKATTAILINFDKSPKPMNPTLVKIDKITASTPVASGVSIVGNLTNVDPVGGVTYQYMRAYIQSPVEVIGSKTLRTKVYYETYQSSGSAVPAKSNGSFSKSGERNWHQVRHESKSGLMSFSNPRAKYSGRIAISNEGNTTLKVIANDLPEKNRVSVKVVSPEFSVGAVDRVSTSVSFIPNTANWAGKGKQGKTIDTNVSKRNGFKKYSW